MYVRQSYMTVLYLIILTVERPTIHEVLMQLVCIDALWYEIGVGLGVSYNVLQRLVYSNIPDRRKLGDIIQNWLDMNGQDEGAPVIWNAILDVVKGPFVQNKSLALTIYKYLKQECSVQQHDQSKSVIVSLVVRIMKKCWLLNPGHFWLTN